MAKESNFRKIADRLCTEDIPCTMFEVFADQIKVTFNTRHELIKLVLFSDDMKEKIRKRGITKAEYRKLVEHLKKISALYAN